MGSRSVVSAVGGRLADPGGTGGLPPDVRGRLMLAFPGTELPPALAARLAAAPAAGISLFRYHNVDSPAQVRELTAAVQRAARSLAPGPPLLVAADQEGGQLLALGEGSTPFPGNMALGATGDPALAERVGRAIGTEALAMGVNVVYAPVCDLATNPANPHLGIRAFGDEPSRVASFVAAMVRGLRSAGVAASAKHFPGLGEADLDTHLELPALGHDMPRLRAIELVPFAAAIDAGVDLVMSAHIALPALTGDPTLPATLAREVMHDLVRGELRFRGLTITDALDMAALPQGPEQAVDVVAAIRAGVDLLLAAPDPAKLERIEAALVHAAARRLFDPDKLRASAARLDALRTRLAGVAQPGLEIVRSEAHLALAQDVARRSITLVRDEPGLLPLRLASDARLVVIRPEYRELTPADTSSSVPPALAEAIRRRHPRTRELVYDEPDASAIAAILDQARGADLLVIGTVSAASRPTQAELVRALLATGIPAVTVALRTPFDLAAFPASTTHVCAYGILEPTCEALAATLFGESPFQGRLPAPIPGLYAGGHGLTPA